MSPLDALFPGNSEMARRMRVCDWDRTELGNPRHWPQALRLALRICLTSHFPMHVWWGAALTNFYNDAYIPLLGSEKHPHVLARSAREAWPEVWGTIGPMTSRVVSMGETTGAEDVAMFIERHLAREEVYLTFSFSPVSGYRRAVEGIFGVCTETTDRIVGARRLETLHRLGVKLSTAANVTDACTAAAEVLATNPFDIPCSAIYLAESHERARRAVQAGFASGHQYLPDFLEIHDDDAPHALWPIAEVLRTRQPVKVRLVGTVGISGGAYADPLSDAIVFPLGRVSAHETQGVFIAGISTRRPLDAAYFQFCETVAAEIGAALTNARAAERERARTEELARTRRDVEDGLRRHERELSEANTALERELGERLAAEAQIKALFRRLIAAQEEERHRVARDLHDQLGQTITALRMSLEVLRNRASEPAVARAEQLAEEIDQNIDFLTSELRPASLDHLGLAAALADLVRRWSEHFQIEAGFEAVSTEHLRLAPDTAVNLYRIVQEALHNVYKHAKASRVSVVLSHRAGQLLLNIEDDGCGLSTSATSQAPESSRLGLIHMRERAALAGGALQLESSSGRGTSVFVRVPVGAPSSFSVQDEID